MLEIKNLKKTINGNYVVKDINLKLIHGEIFWLLGRNGSGKSKKWSIFPLEMDRATVPIFSHSNRDPRF